MELLIARLGETKLYRLNDAITNISCGITQQVIGVLSKTILIVGYLYIHDHWRIFELRESIWSFLLLFIGIDFFYYWFHRYAYEISLFWGAHIVHHQSEEYNLSVALRQSSLQGFVSMAFYIPLALIGFNPISFVASSSFQTLYQF
ncbi:MAG: sterol desaturase family protein [Saprospiraceae bacterium]|nr:sterol desaturase family protein [Saprospiraceae bacterium]